MRIYKNTNPRGKSGIGKNVRFLWYCLVFFGWVTERTGLAFGYWIRSFTWILISDVKIVRQMALKKRKAPNCSIILLNRNFYDPNRKGN